MCITRRQNMGNDGSKHQEVKKTSESSQKTENSSRNPQLEQYFARLADSNGEISYSKLVKTFDEDLAESLLHYFTNGGSKSVSKEQFLEKFSPLYGTSTDIYVKILQPVHHFIKVCSDSAGAGAIQGDEPFIKTLVASMTSGKTGEAATEAILEWRRQKCEKFTQAVQNRVVAAVTGSKHHSPDYSSDILTPLQMWFLQSSLPNFYFPKHSSEVDTQWSPLYTSLQHGISTNRFETLVFDYRGPTVTILRLKDSRIVALATDHEWRHSGSRFGGPFTSFFELSPLLRRIDEPNSIYCNLKLRSSATGLSFKSELKIDKDFDEVHDIEVWGCAGAGTLAEQQKLKSWQKQQAEKHKKVPLPGNWDDNPDKTLLEMAGFQFSNERAAMDMEAKIAAQNSSRSTDSEKAKNGL